LQLAPRHVCWQPPPEHVELHVEPASQTTSHPPFGQRQEQVAPGAHVARRASVAPPSSASIPTSTETPPATSTLSCAASSGARDAPLQPATPTESSHHARCRSMAGSIVGVGSGVKRPRRLRAPRAAARYDGRVALRARLVGLCGVAAAACHLISGGGELEISGDAGGSSPTTAPGSGAGPAGPAAGGDGSGGDGGGGAGGLDPTARTLSAGHEHTCAVVGDGTARCWGNGEWGRLGDGSSMGKSAVPVAVEGLSRVGAISAGGSHTCAVSNGGVWCWGFNMSGQLGDGTTQNSAVPIPVANITDAVAVETGENHSCALLAGGAVRCWGQNGNGQLGDGTTNASNTPIPVLGITGAKSLSVGDYHACVLLAAGELQCWGDGSEGQLGHGDNPGFSSTPVQVMGLGPAVAVAAGDEHTCAALGDGTAWCWGSNYDGQLGYGGPTQIPDGNKTSPIQCEGIAGAVHVAAGRRASCAVLGTGEVWCWGYNGSGQLGTGNNGSSAIPVKTLGLDTARFVTAGNDHTCVRLEDGGIRCWGSNGWGQLGNGDGPDAKTPIKPFGL
jgi:alpha-tubulin suppressor-like RCC1 family protein